MKLSVTVIDERIKPGITYSQGGSTTLATQPYERVTITDASGNAAVIGAILRGIADDIDPYVAESS